MKKRYVYSYYKYMMKVSSEVTVPRERFYNRDRLSM